MKAIYWVLGHILELLFGPSEHAKRAQAIISC